MLAYYDYFLESGIVDYSYSSAEGLTATLRMAAPEYTGNHAGKLIDFQVTGFDPSRNYYLNLKGLRKLHLGGISHSDLSLIAIMWYCNGTATATHQPTNTYCGTPIRPVFTLQ